MKSSRDLVIGGSGDRKNELTAETRRRGDDQTLTTEARRHGERSGDREIACTRIGGAAYSFHDLKIGHTVYACNPERVGADATASRRTPTMSILRHTASGSSYETTNLTAEMQRRGENQKSTTETLRHGEERRSSDFFDHPITRSPLALALLRKTLHTIRATLREIFDESAYDRFLLRTHSSRSRVSYRAFTRERDAAMVKKPRCC